MHYVIIRDDDTNALTPVDCLERLYRPFLERGLPVNLATIPEVSTAARQSNGEPEGFLLPHRSPSLAAVGISPDARLARAPVNAWEGEEPDTTETVSACGQKVPLGSNEQLAAYLRGNPGFHIVQHGCHHEYLEFDCPNGAEIARRLEHGTERLQEAGFSKPRTFVAPYDKLSRAALHEVSRRFQVISTGWFELRRLPYAWWPRYAAKKLWGRPHWRAGKTLLLSHPGCLLSCHRAYSTMLGGIIQHLNTQRLTVLVTHWWEYFRGAQPDNEFIGFLHETASYLATHPHLKVISFDDLVSGDYPLH